jgi:hypothetical protein
MPTHHMTVAVRRNIAHPCKSINCHQPRRNLSGYCKEHAAKAYLYGHPLGYSIPKKAYEHEVSDIEQFFNDNQTHRGITIATTYLDEKLAKASQGRAMQCGLMFQRLASAEVTGLQILKECAAIWLYSQRHPQKLQDDLRLTYALGLCFVKLAPLERRTCWTSNKEYSVRVPSSKVKAVGKLLRTELGLLFHMIAINILKQDAQANLMKEAILEPFN